VTKKLSLFLFFSFFSTFLWADNTLTLPKGRFRARIKPIYSPKISTQYNDANTEESIVSDYAVGVTIPVAAAFSKQLEQAMHMTGVSYLGEFKPDMTIATLVLGTALEYGITNQLTAGFILPVVMASTQFKLGFDKSAEAQNHPLFKNMDMVQLAEQAAVSKGYAPFENWRGIGLGDAELGVKYHALNTTQWSFAMKSGIRIPTGRVDDPDNLTDIGFGDGQWDLGATFLLDYKPLPDLVFNLETRFTWQLPDKESLRVPGLTEIFTNKKENVARNLGDHIQAAISAQYHLFKLFNLNFSYNFFAKGIDRFTSNLANLNTNGLGLDTNQLKHSLNFGSGFSTLPWFLDGQFKLPMDLGVNLELPFFGKNVIKATSFNMEYKLYF